MFWVFIYMKPKLTRLPLLWVTMLWPSTLLTHTPLLPRCFTSIVKVYIIIVSTPTLCHYKLLATLQICSSLLFHCLSCCIQQAYNSLSFVFYKAFCKWWGWVTTHPQHFVPFLMVIIVASHKEQLLVWFFVGSNNSNIQLCLFWFFSLMSFLVYYHDAW
jgi:hypothetical protein